MAVNMIFIYVVHCLIRFRKIIESKNGKRMNGVEIETIVKRKSKKSS